MIQKRLLVVLLALTLLPSALIGWMAYDLLLGNIRAERIKIVGRVADARHHELKSFLLNAQTRANAFISGSIAECLKAGKADRDCTLRKLDRFIQDEGAVGAWLTSSGQKQIIAAGSRRELSKTLPSFQPGQLAYFPAQALAEGRRYYIKTNRGGETLTVVYPASLLQPLFINHPDLGASGETFLADAQGLFITNPRYQPTHGLDHEISARPMLSCLAKTDAEVLDEDYRGEPIIHGFRYIPEIGGGCIMAHIEQKEAFAPLEKLTTQVLLTGAAFLLIAGVVALMLARRLVRPLLNLTDAAKRIGEGEQVLADEGDGDDEISILARTFNRMTGKLAAAQSDLEIQVEERTLALSERTRELERVNTSLAESESFIHAVLDTVLSGIITIDERGIVQSVNQATVRMFGYETDEIVGQNIRMLMPPPYREQHEDYIAQYLESGEREVIGIGREVSGLRKDGSIFPIELAISEMPAPGGKRAFVGVVTDITVRKAAQSMNLRLTRAIEESPVMVIITDTARNIVYVNPAFSAITGYTREEAIGTNINFIKSGNTPDEVYEEMFAQLHAGRSWNTNLEDRRKDGSLFWVSATLSPVRDEQGEIVNFVAVEEDITERKKLEDEVHCHRDHLAELVEVQTSSIKAIVNTAADGIITIDQKGVVLSFNGAAERMFGYGAEEVVGRNINMLMPQPHRDAHDGYMARYLATGEARVIGIGREVAGRRKDGSVFPLYLAVSEVEIGAERHFTGIVRDISQQKEAEAELIRAREAAEAASRAKSNFLANMSHEIRTPMNAIIGMTDLVLDSPLAPEQEKLLRSVASSAKALLTILNDILDLSKLESGKMELESIPFSIGEVLEDVEDVIRVGTNSKGLELKTYLDGSVPPCVIGDPTRLRQVLLNLAGNALKFTQQGSITLAARLGDNEDEWHFSVRDTGIGIAKDRQQKVFERFSQADETTTRRFGGTGLGTSISREIVEHMGGHIWLESEEGRGSDFQFIVMLPPAIGVIDCKSSAMHRFGRSPRTRPLKVLLAEDIVLNQELVVMRLSQRQHSVTVAANGRLAVEYFQREPYDLVLMDVMMPEMDGETATRNIRAIEKVQGGHIPIIMLTASVMQTDQHKYFDAGADSFVGKPIDFNELYSKIANFFPVVEEVDATAQQAVQKLPLVDGIDMRRGLETWGDWVSYRKALAAFKRDYVDTAADLRRQFASGRYDDARMLTHTVKGLAANLGAMELSSAMASLEDRAKQSSAEFAEPLERAGEQMARILVSIGELERAAPVAVVAINTTDAVRALPLLEKLAAALERSKLDEAAIVELRAVLDADRYGHIEALIDAFEFGQAHALIQEIMTRLRKQEEQNG